MNPFFTTKLSKVKIKVAVEKAKKALCGGVQYISTLSLTSALDGMGGQGYAPTVLPPGKTRYPL